MAFHAVGYAGYGTSTNTAQPKRYYLDTRRTAGPWISLAADFWRPTHCRSRNQAEG